MKAFPLTNPTIFGGRRNIYGYILAFLSFLTLTFLTVKIAAPDINSEAANKTISAGSSPYSISVGFEDEVDIPITPTSSQAVYSATQAVSISNTCTAGATVTMTANSTSDNKLTHTDDSTKTISTTTGTTSLDNYSWGYSLDSGSNYAGIPLKGGSAATIYNRSVAETTTVNVTYGVKTDNSLPSGTYTNDLLYTAAVSSSCLTYTVSFDTDGGTSFSDITLNYGDTLDLTQYVPTKSGYVFAGWSNGTNTFDGTETSADINPSNLITLTLSSLYCTQAYNFDFVSPSGGEQTFTPEHDYCGGYYELEVWGAQGGSANSYRGGYGAYATGVTSLEKTDKIYINIGGAGTSNTSKTADVTGGYNGGGDSYHWINNDQYSAAGGGATSISLVSGLLQNQESYKGTLVNGSYYVSSTILIVAGGGGGGVQNAYNPNVWAGSSGAEAGGIQGNNATGRDSSGDNDSWMSGGTQIQGSSLIVFCSPRGVPESGAFGKGGRSSYTNTANIPGGGSGGGAGWYGGGGSTTVATGSGGSSYIASSKLISTSSITKRMTCYNCSTDSNAATLTYSNTTIPTSAPMADVARIGNGYARITFLGVTI